MGDLEKVDILTSRRRGVERASGGGRVVDRQLVGMMNDDSLRWYALALGGLSGNRRRRHFVVLLFHHVLFISGRRFGRGSSFSLPFLLSFSSPYVTSTAKKAKARISGISILAKSNAISGEGVHPTFLMEDRMPCDFTTRLISRSRSCRLKQIRV